MSWALGTIFAGQSRTVVMTMRVNSSGASTPPNGTVIANLAYAFYTENGVVKSVAVDRVDIRVCSQGGDACTLLSTAIGVYRPSTGRWYLDLNGNGQWNGCVADDCLGPFGLPGDLPVMGDWDGTGIEKIGVYRPSTGRWYLDFNGDGQWNGCGMDRCLGPFGLPGDLPVAGDWNNSGITKIGVYRPSTGRWYLDNGNGTWSGCSMDHCLGPFGLPGDRPVAGDWTNSGAAKIGVYRPSTGRWYLDRNGDGRWSGCGIDGCFGPFGIPGDLPVAGDWNNAGATKIGVYRPSTGRWYLDNGSGNWSGCNVDHCLGPFGLPGDRPVAGVW